MTAAQAINDATKTLNSFNQQAEKAGGIESIINKLVRIARGEEGVTLTPREAAACSQAIGVCVYSTNASLIVRHGSLTPASTSGDLPTINGVHVGVGTPEGDSAFAEIISSKQGYR